MNIFKKARKEHVIIIGSGQFGANIAQMLLEQKKEVAIIDIDENALVKLAPSINLLSIIGDGADTDLLELAGIKNSDIVIASTNDDDTNIMISQIAKQIFKVQTVIARIYDSSKEIYCSNMDIFSICSPTLSTNEIKKIFANKENSVI